MYSNSLRSRGIRRKRLFSLKNRERCISIADMEDFPSVLSTWNSQPSLHSTLNKSGTVSSKRCPLFQHHNGGVWSVFDRNLEQECKESDGKMLIKIHNEDRTYKTVMIDDGMRVGEVCEIMLEKNHRGDSIVHWQLFEEPGDFPGFERHIEDHEFAMDLQRRWPAAVAPSRIWFRYNGRKYNFSDNQSKKKAKFLLDLNSMDVYVPKLETDVSSILNTPTLHTLLLVPSSIGLLDPEAIFAIGVKTRESMLAWAEGLRFYKHGQRRLSENLEAALNNRYRPLNQTTEQSNPNEEHVYSQIQQDTLSLYRRNRSPQRVEYAIDSVSRGGMSSNFGRWGNYHQESYSNVDNSPPLRNPHFPTSTVNASNGSAPWQQSPNSHSDVYESGGNFEGIVFQSGMPFLHLELPDGVYRFPIEVQGNRGFEDKRYKLTFRGERFVTLNDLSRFYEERRHLLVGSNGFHNVQPSQLRADSATAF